MRPKTYSAVDLPQAARKLALTARSNRAQPAQYRVRGIHGAPAKAQAARRKREAARHQSRGVLERLLPRFQRQFPTFRDEVTLTEVFEEAGRRIVTREERSGPIEKLHGCAWVTLRSVATSWLRRGSSRLSQRTLGADESQAALSTVATGSGTPEQIERDILLREVLAQMTADERLVCLWKTAGFSSEEIAHHREVRPPPSIHFFPERSRRFGEYWAFKILVPRETTPEASHAAAV